MKALLALLTLASAQPQRFDLVCSGPVPAKMASFAEPVDIHLRVDLSTDKWCYADCEIIRPIAEVQPSVIFFEKPSAEEKLRELGSNRLVDRKTGEYLFSSETLLLGRRHATRQAGVCHPEPFSGFPEVETRF